MKVMCKKWIVLCGALSMGAMARQQDPDLIIPVDIARFRAQEGYAWVEIYFSIPRERLKYRSGEQGAEAEFAVGVEVFQDDSLIHQDAWRSVDRIDSLSQVQTGQQINEQTGLYLKEGMYDLKITVRDRASERRLSAETPFQVKPFPAGELALSDMELALDIGRSGKPGKFVKNGYRIVPNPYALYGLEWPLLAYYCEIYNLTPLAPDRDSTYTVRIWIEDGLGRRIRELPPRTGVRRGASLVEVGSTVVSTLVSGKYRIGMEVTDPVSGDTARTGKPFFIFRKSDYEGGETLMADDLTDYRSAYSQMSEAELDEQFDQLRYLAGNEEKSLYKDLDLEGKRRFMANFWKARDPDPAAPGNPFMQAYLEQIAYVKSHFSLGRRPGWRTDRGRVYLTYGKPDQITRSQSSMGDRRYEIWSYDNLDTGVEFVFVDRTGFGEMELVHSTYRSEIHDYEWREKYLR